MHKVSKWIGIEKSSGEVKSVVKECVQRVGEGRGVA